MLFAVSCDGNGCIEADEFDTKYVKVESNPVKDGVFGSYDDVDGGQVAEWHNTGLRTANEDFIIMVSGGWVPWKADTMTFEKFETLEGCNFCSKRSNDASQNCICHKNQIPIPEIGASGRPVETDCDLDENQNNPNLCTCTTKNGKADDYGIFHFPLNYYQKDHTRKNPDDQSDACAFRGGMGLYLGVFGKSSNEPPKRVYHLFSEQEVCPIARDAKGKCIDEHGQNRLKYVFKSRDQKNFVKDDQAGNDGLDVDAQDDIYHGGNEYVKLIIFDRYYSDNFGHYNVEFLKGTFDDNDIGLLEFLVRIVEDQLLGEFNEIGEREGGILEFLFNAIAKDSNFLLIFQITLSIYITFFGASVLLGFVELNKKEVYSRIVKVAAVIFFVNPDSWEFYNQIVVGFFKDGMDEVIDIILSIGEVDLDKETNPLVLAQLGSANPGSTGSRFSYVDVMLRTLFSDNVTKKIWGLFFYDIFGWLYIALIYGAIFYFLYVMLIAATVYAVTITKMIFVLALGPIFIPFALFKYTSEIFKKWISFLGARSIEMIILFLLLYTFVGFIDKRFNELLYYKVCYQFLVNGYINIKVLKASIDRSMIDWLSQIITLMLFTFMAHMVFEQIPTLAGSLISIGGNSNKGNSDSGFKLAGSMIGDALSGAKGAAGLGLSAAGEGFRGLRKISRATGVSGLMNAVSSKVPFRGIRTRMRDSVIDKAIKEARASGMKKGLQGAALDGYVRNFALNDAKLGVFSWTHKNKKLAALGGFDTANVLKRMDTKLAQQPLKDYLKERAKELKKLDPTMIPLGKEMTRQLKKDARAWADKNLAGGSAAIDKHLHDMKNFIKKEGSLTIRQAAKRFGDDEGLKNKYLQHLRQSKLEKHGNKPVDLENSKKAKKFLRQAHDRKVSLFDQLTGKKVTIGALGSRKEEALRKMANEAEHKMLRSYLTQGQTRQDIAQSDAYYKNKIKQNSDSENKQRLLAAKQERVNQDILNKREFHKEGLQAQIKKQMANAIQGKSQEEIIEMRTKAMEDLERMKKAHKEKMDELIGDDKWQETMNKNGGRESYKDGLIDINGDSLFEAKARAKALGCFDRDSVGSSNEEAMKEEFNKIEQARKALEESLEAAKTAKTQEEKEAAAKAVEEAAAELENANSKLGSSLDNILLSQADVQAINIGANNNQNVNKNVDQAALVNFEFNKNQAQAKVKMKKFEKAQKEYEIATLQKQEKPDHAKINALKNEVVNIESEISSEERRVSSIDEQINYAKNSNTNFG